MEELELVLHPMVEVGKEPTGSMGDDTPLAVLSGQYRGLHYYFRQMFAQVTNPPIDSLREYSVMSLLTRLGSMGNIFADEPEQTALLQLDSPVLTNGEFAGLIEYLGDKAVWIDCTFDASPGRGRLTAAIERIRGQAEEAVRGGATHLILTDEHVSEERAPIPMILAAGGVHSHLVRQRLRTFTSINVRAAECLDVHYFAVLIGVGANHDQPVRGAGEPGRPAGARAVRQPQPGGVRGALPQRRRCRASQGPLQDGHFGAELIPERL